MTTDELSKGPSRSEDSGWSTVSRESGEVDPRTFESPHSYSRTGEARDNTTTGQPFSDRSCPRLGLHWVAGRVPTGPLP